MAGKFHKDLEKVLAKYERGTESETPDNILAGFVRDILTAWTRNVKRRDRWHNADKFSSGGKQ